MEAVVGSFQNVLRKGDYKAIPLGFRAHSAVCGLSELSFGAQLEMAGMGMGCGVGEAVLVGFRGPRPSRPRGWTETGRGIAHMRIL